MNAPKLNDIAYTTLLPQQLCVDVLQEKYCSSGETTIQEVQTRIAKALADTCDQEGRFFEALQQGFIPGGRINSAAGTDRVSTLINCFVQPVEDTITGEINGMPGIMKALDQAAETMRRGGGVGYDFSRIRPMHAKVKGTQSRASGPVSYMRVFDRMCQTVESAGGRRGAQMGVLRIDHPDIELFIDAKKTPDFQAMGLNEKDAADFQRMIQSSPGFGWTVRQSFATLSNFNISAGVTDEFMNAVLHDQDFDLVHRAEPAYEAATKVCEDGQTRYIYKTVKAHDLWNRIMRNTYSGAEPGVLFLSTINELNNLRYCENIEATNPCGEQVLPAYGCCDLGAMALMRFVKEPFTPQAWFDFESFAQIVAAGVELLDSVLDKTNWPLAEQRVEAQNKRRIGLGFTGLADALAMLGLKYSSEEGRAMASKIAQFECHAAYRASIELSKQKGPFPFFNAESYLEDGTFASTLPAEIKADIRRHGIRNSHLLSIAPTGTISMAFGDNCASGIEPIFSLRQKRNKIMADGSRQSFELENHAYRLGRTIQREALDMGVFETALNLDVQAHLKMCAAIAPFVDAAISKTINVPVDYPFEDFQKVYMDAWMLGLKGITTYRPNDMIGAVLVDADEKDARVQNLRDDDPDRRVLIKDVSNMEAVLRWPSRPDVPTQGVTYLIRHPQGNFALVVNHWKNGGKHPLEVYVAGNEQPRGLSALAKSLSVDMRTDDAAWLNMKLDTLSTIAGDDGFEMTDPATLKKIQMPSMAAGFAHIVRHRLSEIGALQAGSSSVMMDALFSKREPKTGPEGSMGWHCDINNPNTDDDFLVHVKELVLSNGQVRPYSVWLSGRYPKILDGLTKMLSIDLRVSDPKWAAMKLRKLLNFGEVRGDFWAPVPHQSRQKLYPSTVAYVAEVLLARMTRLGLIDQGAELSETHTARTVNVPHSEVKASGRQCPQCHTMSLHKRDGCDVCDHCGHTGSCG